MKPQECINNNCTTIFYVKNHELGLCLQCEKCINKTK
jgi:hypothetical protein